MVNELRASVIHSQGVQQRDAAARQALESTFMLCALRLLLVEARKDRYTAEGSIFRTLVVA